MMFRREQKIQVFVSISPQGSSSLQTAKYNKLLDRYINKAVPTATDKKESKFKVHKLLQDILQVGDSIYNGSLECAGSTSTNTKVGKADEFDINLHLNLSLLQVDKLSPIRYTFFDEVRISECYFKKRIKP